MAFAENVNARRRGNHAGVFHCVAAFRRCPVCLLPQSRAGRIHVQLSLRHEGGCGDYISRSLRRLHSASALAGYGVHRNRNRDRSVSLNAALARYEQDIYYREEFERLAQEHSNFDFLPTLSRGGPEWKGLRGYVQEHVPGIVGDRSDMHAYICGLDKMVSVNRGLLKSLGWDRKQILYEKYD